MMLPTIRTLEVGDPDDATIPWPAAKLLYRIRVFEIGALAEKRIAPQRAKSVSWSFTCPNQLFWIVMFVGVSRNSNWIPASSQW